MLDRIFHRASVRTNSHQPNWQSHLSLYVEYLVSRGHSAGTIHQYVFAVEHFGRWLNGRPRFMHR